MKNVEPNVLLAQATALEELLADKERWIKGSLARNVLGNSVDPMNDGACKFCLIGAMAHVLEVKRRKDGAEDIYQGVMKHPLALLVSATIVGVEDGDMERVKESEVIFDYNDGDTTHEQVMEVVSTVRAFAAGMAA